MKRLADLLGSVSGVVAATRTDVAVAGIRYDSRAVRPGDVFVALPGQRSDGHRFIPEAIAAGATAVVVSHPAALSAGTTPPSASVVIVRDTRRALAELSSAFHDHPSHRLRLVGVTGTDGKTTTTCMIAHLLRAAGCRVGMISTVEVHDSLASAPNTTSHTTPQAPELQALLHDMADRGAEVAVVEVSSHALALQRLAGSTFAGAVFTNLSPEHLDFHLTIDAYRTAKAELFRMLGATHGVGGYGIVNADDPSAETMARACRGQVWRYSLEGNGDVTLERAETVEEGMRLHVRTYRGPIVASSTVVGRPNLANWLAAISAALAHGIDPAVIAAAMPHFSGVRGRLQRVDAGQPFRVVVDFAHTPNALAEVLGALRRTTPGRLIVVFGHAGGRDRRNRAPLGAVAARLSDLAIVTTDDPYDEDPNAIVAEVEEGLLSAGGQKGSGYWKIVDRLSAIGAALREARPEDTVLIAGRGHETHTTIGNRTVAFDDTVVVRDELAKLGYGGGAAA